MTGNCESGEIHTVAAVIKKMLETMLEYEAQKEEKIKRKSREKQTRNDLSIVFFMRRPTGESWRVWHRPSVILR